MGGRVSMKLTFGLAMKHRHLRVFNAGMLMRGFDCEAVMSKDGKAFFIYSDTDDIAELIKVREWVKSGEHRTLFRDVGD